MPFYKRAELQAVAQAKLDDARLLYTHGRYSNAYYLAGYSVEIGLKACIARQITADVIPDKDFINQTYVHKLRTLVGVAGLSQELQNRERNDPAFAASWAIVAEWNPEVRYEGVDAHSAGLLITAIADGTAGVFPWIKTYW